MVAAKGKGTVLPMGFISLSHFFLRGGVKPLCNVLNGSLVLHALFIVLVWGGSQICRMDIRPYGSASYIPARSFHAFRAIVRPYFHIVCFIWKCAAVSETRSSPEMETQNLPFW